MGNVNVSFFCCLTLQKGKKKLSKKIIKTEKKIVKNCQKLLKKLKSCLVNGH